MNLQLGTAIPGHDGLPLIADVFAGPTPDAPVLCIRTPYGRSLHTSEALAWQATGYAVVVQDVRGRHDSAGEPTADAHVHRADAAAMIDWLAADSAMTGPVISYGTGIEAGFAWLTAIARPNRMAAVVTSSPDLVAGTQIVRDNGATCTAATLWRAGLTSGRVSKLNQADALTAAYPELLELPADQIPGWPTPADSVPPDSGPLIDPEDLSAHAIPALHVTSWYDPNLLTALDLWHAHRSTSRADLLVGFWVTPLTTRLAPGCDLDFGGHENTPLPALIADWLAETLSGQSRPHAVRRFQLGSHQWIDGDREQAPGTSWSWFGDRDARLTTSRPGHEPVNRELVADEGRRFPAGFAELDQSATLERDDAISWISDPLEAPLTISGAPRVLARIEAGVGALAVARLLDIHPDGRAFELRTGVQPISDETRSPADAHDIEIPMAPLEIALAAGHRLCLQISGDAVPRYAPSTDRLTAVSLDPERPVELVMPVADAITTQAARP